MKIIKNKKPREIKGIHYVQFNNQREYDAIIDWHDQLHHRWAGGQKMKEFDAFDFGYPFIATTLIVNRRWLTYEFPKGSEPLSFNEFMELAYA